MHTSPYTNHSPVRATAAPFLRSTRLTIFSSLIPQCLRAISQQTLVEIIADGNFVERALRLYEKEPGEASASSRFGVYGRRAGSGGQGRVWLSGTLELRSEPAEPQDTHRSNYCLPISLKARPQYLVNFVLLSLKQFKTRSSPNLTSGQYFSASAPH